MKNLLNQLSLLSQQTLTLYYNKLRLHFSKETSLDLAVEYLLDMKGLPKDDELALIGWEMRNEKWEC